MPEAQQHRSMRFTQDNPAIDPLTENVDFFSEESINDGDYLTLRGLYEAEREKNRQLTAELKYWKNKANGPYENYQEIRKRVKTEVLDTIERFL